MSSWKDCSLRTVEVMLWKFEYVEEVTNDDIDFAVRKPFLVMCL